MRVFPRFVIRGRTAEVVLRHGVGVVVVDTAFRKHRLRQSVRVVRVGIKIRVDVANRRIFRIDTGTVGHCLVGVVFHMVLLNGTLITISAQSIQFEACNRFPIQFSLEFQVGHTYIYIVVFQFMENVEVRPVARIEFMRIERARRVQSVAVRINVKPALHLAAHRVGLLAQRARSFLLAIRIGSQHRHTQCRRNLIRRVGIERVAAHVARNRPSRVVHDRNRRIEIALFRTAGNADRVVLQQCVAEKFVEPIRVAEFGCAQIIIHRRSGVRKAESAVRFVILIDQIIHFTIYAGIGRGSDACKFEPSFAFHFPIDTHLLLRVADVELVVTGFHTGCEFAGVADTRRTCATFLRRHDDHAGHCLRTINRRCRTVLQNLEALDVVGVQTRDGGRNQRHGITRRQIVGRNLDCIFHDDAIDHPQRLGSAIDGSRATHANLRSRTERTGYVLHRNAGRTAFQRAGNICHTVQFGLVGVDLGSRACKQTAVHFRHTGNDNFIKLLSIRAHYYSHLFCRCFQNLCLHSNVRHFDL